MHLLHPFNFSFSLPPQFYFPIDSFTLCFNSLLFLLCATYLLSITLYPVLFFPLFISLSFFISFLLFDLISTPHNTLSLSSLLSFTIATIFLSNQLFHLPPLTTPSNHPLKFFSPLNSATFSFTPSLESIRGKNRLTQRKFC